MKQLEHMLMATRSRTENQIVVHEEAFRHRFLTLVVAALAHRLLLIFIFLIM